MKSSRIRNTTDGIKKGEKCSWKFASDDYIEAVKRFPLKVITSEEHNEKALEVFKCLNLASIKGQLGKGESDYMRVLMFLISDFESKTYKSEKKPEPKEVVRFFMQQHDLRQKDMVPHIFETQSIVSEVLSGKKQLTVEHIKRLSERFCVKAELFLD